jgi:hypothetical protein
MPNLDNIRLWVDALRSGEYEQGLHVLHNLATNTWCCLGVACDVARKNGVAIQVADSVIHGEGPKLRETFDGHGSYLPPSVQNWLGIDSDNPVLDDIPATDWNDIRNASFNGIADAIEAEFLREENI